FPEGTRYKQGLMENLESGIAMIALRSGVKILPAYIVGEVGLFKRIHVYYGQPLSLSEIAKKETNKAACDEVLALITQTYRDMRQKAMEA
ncbi:MAG: 1-acyl-sn-glycerol-3-phosphate acyltransferase, partial [Clostridia bacterium]